MTAQILYRNYGTGLATANEKDGFITISGVNLALRNFLSASPQGAQPLRMFLYSTQWYWFDFDYYEYDAENFIVTIYWQNTSLDTSVTSKELWFDVSMYVLEKSALNRLVESEAQGEAGAVVYDTVSLTFLLNDTINMGGTAHKNPMYWLFDSGENGIADTPDTDRHLIRILATRLNNGVREYKSRYEGMMDIATITYPIYVDETGEHIPSCAVEVIDKLSALNLLQNIFARNKEELFEDYIKPNIPDSDDINSIVIGKYTIGNVFYIYSYEIFRLVRGYTEQYRDYFMSAQYPPYPEFNLSDRVVGAWLLLQPTPYVEGQEGRSSQYSRSVRSVQDNNRINFDGGDCPSNVFPDYAIIESESASYITTPHNGILPMVEEGTLLPIGTIVEVPLQATSTVGAIIPTTVNKQLVLITWAEVVNIAEYNYPDRKIALYGAFAQNSTTFSNITYSCIGSNGSRPGRVGEWPSTIEVWNKLFYGFDIYLTQHVNKSTTVQAYGSTDGTKWAPEDRTVSLTGVEEIYALDGIKCVEALIKLRWNNVTIINNIYDSSHNIVAHMPIPLSYIWDLINDRPFDKEPLAVMTLLANAMNCYIYFNNDGNLVLQNKLSVDYIPQSSWKNISSFLLKPPTKKLFWDKLVDAVEVTVTSWLLAENTLLQGYFNSNKVIDSEGVEKDKITPRNLLSIEVVINLEEFEKAENIGGFGGSYDASAGIIWKDGVLSEAQARNTATADFEAVLNAYAEFKANKYKEFYGARHLNYEFAFSKMTWDMLDWDIMDIFSYNSKGYFLSSINEELESEEMSLNVVSVDKYNYSKGSVTITKRTGVASTL